MRNMKNKKLKSVLSITGYFLLVIAICFSASLIFHNFYYEQIYVSGNSMSPTLNGAEDEQAGSVVDFGIMDTHKSALKNIERFSIVSTYYPDEIDYDLETGKLRPGAKQKIKRVIALPGEVFKIENGKLSVLKEGGFEYIPYTFKTNPAVDEEFNGKDISWLKLSDDEYWVLGDNRGNSRDCAIINKPIKKENLVGVLVAIEGKARLETDYYICYKCGKKYEKGGNCTNKDCEGAELHEEYTLVKKKHHWPKYF